VIPYLEQIARPGCKVTLLIHYSVEGLDWFQSESTMSVIKEQKLMAEKNTFALEPLRETGVTVALDIYAGPLRKVVKQYTGRGDIDLVMIPTERRSRIGRLFQNCFLLNFSSLAKSSSVLLLRPDISERDQ
jgi:hypothetical protein